MKPLTDSLGSLGRIEILALASPRGSGAAEAAPSPRVRIEAEASPVARSKGARPKLRAFRGIPASRSSSKSLSDRGSARRPCRSPGSRPRSRSFPDWPPFGSRRRREPSPFPCPLDLGAIPAAFAGSARLPAPKSLSACHGRFREIRSHPLSLGGRASFASLPSASGASVLGGATAPSAWASRPSVWRPVSGPPPFRPRHEAVSFSRVGEGESGCG